MHDGSCVTELSCRENCSEQAALNEKFGAKIPPLFRFACSQSSCHVSQPTKASRPTSHIGPCIKQRSHPITNASKLHHWAFFHFIHRPPHSLWLSFRIIHTRKQHGFVS